MNIIAVWLLGMGFCLTAVRAETITLKNGIVARGRIVQAEETGIRVEYPGGKVIYHRREEVLDVQRENDPVLLDVGGLRAKGDLPAAEESLRRAIAAQPVAWLAERYRLELMECQLARAHFAEAVETYLEIVQSNPDTAQYARMPAPIYDSQENKSALRRLERRLGQTGVRRFWMSLVRFMLGSILAAEGRADEAQNYLDALRASREERASQLALLLSAEIAMARSNFSEAADTLEKGIPSLPDGLKPRAYFLLGSAYAKAGDFKRAAVAFLRVPILYANDSPALQAECLYQGAISCEKANLKEQADNLRKELLQKFPSSRRALSVAR